MQPKLDIDQIRLFKILFKERRLSKAASIMGLSMPSASRMLASLRQSLGDELFVRYSHGMTPTARAQELMPIISMLLDDYERLFSHRTFSPATLSRQFRIAAVDHAAASFLIGPVMAIQQAAPGASIVIEPITADFEFKLKSGELDFAVYPINQAAKDLSAQPLCEDHFVYACRRGHPILERIQAGPVAAAELSAWPSTEIVVSTGADLSRNDRLALTPAEAVRSATFERQGRFCTHYFLSAFLLAAMSDAVTHLPVRLLESLEPLVPLVAFGRSARAGVFLPQLIWSSVRSADPAHAWLRAMIVANQSQKPLAELMKDLPVLADGPADA